MYQERSARSEATALALAAGMLCLGPPPGSLAQGVPGHPNCVTPPAGLADWWPFDEALLPAAIQAHDIAGATNNDSLPFLSGPTPVAGMVSNALSFDGMDDFLEVPDHPEIDFAGACGAPGVEDFTIDLWVKPDANVPLLPILDKREVANVGGAICARGYALAIQNGRLVFQMADGAGSPCHTTYTGATVLRPGVWHFVAVSVPRCQAAGGFLYVDGKVDGVIAPRAGSLENTNSLFIGRTAVAGAAGFNYFQGCLDELEIFKRALPKAELDAIFQAGSAGKCKPPNCIRMVCPTEIVVTTSSNCAPAMFSVTATNPCCTKALVTCFPPSGSLFPLGTNLVTCVAADVCESRQFCSFNVMVLPDTNACQPPAIIAQPVEAIVPQGSTAMFSVTAAGTAPLAYQWRRGGANLAGETSPTLTLPNAQRPQAGGYSVVMSNACGSVTSLVAQLLIGRPAVPDVALTVDVSSAVRVGSNVVYTLTLQNIGGATASGLVLTGYWASAQAGLQSAPAGCVFDFQPNALAMTCAVGSLPVGGMTNYTIGLLAFGVGGVSFTGSVSGDPSELNLLNNSVAATTGLGFPPGIDVQPMSFASTPGGAGSFSLVATGTPPLSFSWRHSGIAVGAGGATLNFTEIHASDAGDYDVVVSNPWGEAVSAPATLTLSYPPSPTAAVDGSQTLRVSGSSGADDLEVRLAAGDPTTLEIDNLAAAGTEFTFPVSSFTRLVIELGDQNNRLVFNDANGRVTALNKFFEIYGGTGSNLVVASSTGIDLGQLPALLGTLSAAPDFEALANGLYDQANTNLLTPSIDLVGRLNSNMVQVAQMLLAMAQTNLAAEASNLVAQATALSLVASNCANDAVCLFADPSRASAYQCHDFTNCLFQLINQLEALEDTLLDSGETNSMGGPMPDPAPGSPEDQAESLSDMMEALIEAHEEGAERFELGLDAIFDTGASNYNAKVALSVEGPGETLGETNGPAFEALGEAFEALAEQLLEMQAAMVEAEADALTTHATNLEAAADAVAQQAASLDQALAAFTAAADPPPSMFQFAPAGGPPTGTNAGCDRDITANNSIVINIGGIIIGTPTNDTIHAHPGAFLILGLGGDDLIFGNTNFNIVFGGSGNDEIHALAGIDLLFGGPDHDCIFGDERFDLLFGGDGDDNLHGGTNLDLVIGWDGDDKLFGDDNIDLLLGWDGDDAMDGGDHIDVMFGGAGDDTMTGGKGFKFTNNIPFICKFEIGNLMFGGPDNDKLFGSDGLDVMFGLGGADELWASNQVDVLFGNAGNDKIVAGDGGALFYILPSPGVTNGIRLGAVAFGGPDDDTIEGGNDIDLLFGGGGNDTARGSYSYDIFDYPNLGFECGVVDLSFDIDLLFGGGGNDTLDGGHDSDLIFGGPGDDTLLGNGETNKIAFPEIGLLFGGPDNDTVIGGTNDLLTLAFGGRGGDFIQGSSLGVMNLLFGSQDADTIDGYGDLLCLAFGGRDDDTVHGGGFVLDLLFGGKNDDTMHGKAGTLDLMFGNDGDDDMSGGNSVLNLMFGNQGNDTMRSGSSALGILFGNAGCDTMFNESLVGLAFGNREADALFGGPSLVEIFFGNDGEDYVEGGGLIDVLFGNGDNDTLRSGPVLSLVFGNSGHDTLHGSAVLDLLFGNTGNDHIYGNAGPDLIFGGQDNDKIDGGDWPDLIFGGPGQDILLGNDGLDLVFGGPDGDFIYGGSDTDLLFGGRGATGDTIDGGLWRDIIFGQKGVDYLDGGAEKDRIWGGQDTDYLVARGDDTRLRGNKGDDQFWIASGSGVRVHGGPGSDVYQGSPSKVTSASSGSVSFTFPVPACAEIHGTKWQDLNANGVRDPGEPGLVGVTITLNNGAAGATVTMADDPGTKADETGMYWFTLLPAGNYTVREIVPPGSVQTFPSGNAGHSVTLGVIDIATGRDFGNRPCAPPPSGLVMWLPLDENGGNVAHNRAGGLNGAHHNAPAVASGFVDRSRGYGASNQFTEVPSHGLITVGTNDFTLDAWVRRGPASGNGIEVIVDKRKRVSAPVIGTLGYSLFLYEGRLWCQLADGPHANYDSGLAVPADSQWHFVAVSVQRRATNGGRFHVDGATAPFNPTARTGSLDHAGHLGVGHSPLLADSGWFPGGIDEVELFNRALSAAELTEIFNAKWIGKCKLRCHLPAVASFCGNAQAVSIVAQLCNLSGMHDTFTYSFAGLPAGPGCDVAGPATFSPASGSVSLAPGACANIPVTIARPAGMGGPSSTLQTACYTFTLAGAESGMSMVCTGKLSRPPNGLCLDLPADTLADFPVHVTADGLPSLPGGSRDVAVPLRLANGGTNPASLTVVVRVVPADAAGPGAISLNGLPPGEPVIRGVTVPPGGTTNLDVRVELLRNDPYRHLTLLIEADLDGDGLPEPLRSVAVQEIVQGRMDIERVLFATPAPGGTSSRVPSVSWSGFGTLQSAPTLPVPWKDVPGNPGSPHTVTNPAAMTEFFRLRQ